MLYQYSLQTRLGTVTLYYTDEALVYLTLSSSQEDLPYPRYLTRYFPDEIPQERRLPLADQFAIQFAAYLKGKRQEFDLPILLYGTEFEHRVWEELRKIPYGTTISYGELAQRCGTGGARAIGSAVGRNPLPIVVPCHRVIRSDGTLSQYSAGEGTETKRFLLTLEGAPFQK